MTHDPMRPCDARVGDATSAARSFALALAALLGGFGCTVDHRETWSYSLSLDSRDAHRLHVDAHFLGQDPAYLAFAPPEPRAWPYIRPVNGGDDPDEEHGHGDDHEHLPTTPTDGSFRLVTPTRNARISYVVDLTALAMGERDLKVAIAAGDGVYAPWTSWLLLPDGDRDAQVELRFEDSRERVAMAWDRDGAGVVRARSEDLRRLVYSGFGDLDVHRAVVDRGDAPPAAVTLAAPRDAFALPIHHYASWIEANAALVGSFAGGFPVADALVLLVPTPGGRGPVFGRVQPSPAPSLIAFTGAESTLADLADDWILVHELLHMAFPPVSRRDRWIDEGFATYFEPLLRARAGRITESELWAELARGLPRGRRALEERGLHRGRGIDDVYWGGALFCFLADVEARRRTDGARGLEDGVRSLLAAGYSVTAPMTPVERVLPILDRAIGVDVLSPLWRRHSGSGGAPTHLDETLRALGVTVDSRGSVTLSDAAPLAKVRRAISTGRAAP